jgi:tRNA (guanine37-N1)-methyltransferase
MNFTVVTLLPELIEPALAAGVVGRGRDAGLLTVATVNPREFTHDKHRTVDDTPYGGGPGMVMKPEPLLAAIARATTLVDAPAHRILLSPVGAPLTQRRVRELAALPHLVLVCGRYEGVDQRVVDLAIDEELSLGDYVLSGGELGALVVIDAVARLIPGVLGEPTSADDESFAGELLEYPQYTRPLRLDGHEVPAVLTSGNHAVIAAWRRGEAMQRTARRRPDLWARFRPSKADRKLLGKLPALDVAARSHLALVHYPVRDRTGAIVTTAVTNFDLHDLARSTLTYGLAGYHVVTPVTSQRDKAAHIATLWLDDQLGESRAQALARLRTAPGIDEVIAAITAAHGEPPLVVATSAKATSFPAARHLTTSELVTELRATTAPLLLLLGTGWGLAEEMIPSVTRVLAPIEGRPDWNHLAVRSAGAILLDRLFGLAERA